MFPVFFSPTNVFFHYNHRFHRLQIIVRDTLEFNNIKSFNSIFQEEEFFLYKIVPLMFTDTKGDFSVEFMLCSFSRKFSFFLYNFMQST